MAVLLLALLCAACTPQGPAGSSGMKPPRSPIATDGLGGSATGSSVAPADLKLNNGTPLSLHVFVDDELVRVVPPDAGEVTISRSELPPMPWSVELRTDRDRPLLSLPVDASDIWATTAPNGETTVHGAANRVELSCGRIDVWAGPPLSGPAPGPGEPGDCEP